MVTEGVFTRMILDDPALEGVAGVVFDEFHERSLDADLGLALARDAQSLLRDDLRLLVMSATLDGARGRAPARTSAPVIESQGRHSRSKPATWAATRAAPLRGPGRPRRAQRALAEETGSLLVFLPGQGEIRRTETGWPSACAADRRPRAALRRAGAAPTRTAPSRPRRPGRRKVVLATSIAETSLTIEGVRVVIDSRPRRACRASIRPAA